MKHYFVDTNIIIDMLADREGFADAACKLFDSAEKKEIKLYICSLSYSNIYYIIRKMIGHEETINALKTLSEIITILSVDSSVITKALNSSFNDFEDAMQYYCAESNSDINGIVTRNSKDFKESLIPILTPSEVLS